MTRFHLKNVIPDALLFLEETHNHEYVQKDPAGIQKDSTVKKKLGRGRGRGRPLKEKEDAEFITRYPAFTPVCCGDLLCTVQLRNHDTQV